MKNEYLSVSVRQLIHGFLQVDSIKQSAELRVGCTRLYERLGFVATGLGGFVERNLDRPFLPEFHQRDVYGEPVQPGIQLRFAPKRVYLAEKLEKSFLRQIFRFGRIVGHAQAQAKDAPAVQLIEALEATGVSLLSKTDCFGFGHGAWLRFPGYVVGDSRGFTHKVYLASLVLWIGSSQ